MIPLLAIIIFMMNFFSSLLDGKVSAEQTDRCFIVKSYN